MSWGRRQARHRGDLLLENDSTGEMLGPQFVGEFGKWAGFVGDEDGDWLVETCLIMSSLHHLQTTSNQDEQGSCGWQTPHAHTGNDLHCA